MDGESFDNDYIQPVKAGGGSEFELMHVKVTVLGLTGITKSKVPSAKRKYKKKKFRGGSHDAEESVTSSHDRNIHGQSMSASTCSSFGSASAQQPSNSDIPIVANVAFRRNVTNNQTAIATYLPSLPLDIPRKEDREQSIVASWPAENHPFLLQKGEIDRASYSFSRIMMRESYMALDGQSAGSNSNFTSETVDLRINLSQGKEIVQLGIASLVITGDEEGAELMNLPAKAVTFKGDKMELGPQKDPGKLSFFRNPKKSRTAFPSDPTSFYTLSDNAMLRVVVKVLPSNAIKAAESIEAAKLKETFEAKRSFRRELENVPSLTNNMSGDGDQENKSALGNAHPTEKKRSQDVDKKLSRNLSERHRSFDFDRKSSRNQNSLLSPGTATLGCSTHFAEDASSVTNLRRSRSSQSCHASNLQRSRSSQSRQNNQQKKDALSILSIADYICGNSNPPSRLPHTPAGAYAPSNVDVYEYEYPQSQYKQDNGDKNLYICGNSNTSGVQTPSNLLPSSSTADFTMDSASLQKYAKHYARSQDSSVSEYNKQRVSDTNVYIRLAKKGVDPLRTRSNTCKAVKNGF